MIFCPLTDVACLLLEGLARLLGTVPLKGHLLYVHVSPVKKRTVTISLG